jgi:hypothetical protein
MAGALLIPSAIGNLGEQEALRGLAVEDFLGGVLMASSDDETNTNPQVVAPVLADFGSPDPCGNEDGTPKWQFPSNRKVNQATRRGWDQSKINNTLSNPAETRLGINLATGNPATVYYRSDGHYVMRDNVTCDVFHFSDTNNSQWIDPFDNKPIRPR